MEGLLRQGLLAGTTVFAAVPKEGPGAAAAAACSELTAKMIWQQGGPHDEPWAERVAAEIGEREDTVDLLVVEAEPGEGEDSDAALVTALGEVWNVVHTVANAALIPQERGKIVLIGPRPEGGTHAEALRAGLENMARTLSIEWARYGILPTMIAPGPRTTDDEVATLVTYLASPAGDYYSGCRFDLGSAAG